jgi:isoleucyl-tRNA synthetase
MRWLFASAKPELNLKFGYDQTDETRRRFLIPLWNVYSFLVTYARLDNWTPDKETGQFQSPLDAHAQLDRWILARLAETTAEVTGQLEQFASDKAAISLEAYLDDLSNWYVRRSRRRFWKSEADADKSAAYYTLYAALFGFIKLLAPFIPFTTEAIYQNLVRSVDPDAPLSVHHCDWPEVDPKALDQALLNKMRLAIDVASLGRSARSAADFKLRQPLAKVRVNVGSQQARQDLMELADVLAEEINVKEIEVVSEVGELVNYKLLPNNRLMGPKYGARFPKVRQALAKLDPAEAARELHEGGKLIVEVEGEQLSLNDEEVLVLTESRGGLAVASDKGITVAVDTDLTPALVQEGYARDLVRVINTMRKDAGLELDDRIALSYEAEGEVAEALSAYAAYIKQETLASSLKAEDTSAALHQQSLELEGHTVKLGLKKTD